MILFFDEDTGQGVPRALVNVDLKTVLWVAHRYGTRVRTPDVRWLTDAGREKWLAFSCNTEILNVQTEREVIENEKVGIVFLTSGQEKAPDLLRLVLNRWDWLQAIDAQPRPFVYTVTIKGRHKKVPIAPLTN